MPGEVEELFEGVMRDMHVFADRTGECRSAAKPKSRAGGIRELASFLDVLLFGFGRSVGLLAALFKKCRPGGNHASSVVGGKGGAGRTWWLGTWWLGRGCDAISRCIRNTYALASPVHAILASPLGHAGDIASVEGHSGRTCAVDDAGRQARLLTHAGYLATSPSGHAGRLASPLGHAGHAGRLARLSGRADRLARRVDRAGSLARRDDRGGRRARRADHAARLASIFGHTACLARLSGHAGRLARL
eukprot:6210402-Pleurochrysis_carterae.AAC.1